MLPRAAESVLSQDIGNLIWVVVNDGGATRDVEIVIQDFRSKSDNDVIVIHNEASAGMEAATNIGITSSDSEYINLLDTRQPFCKSFFILYRRKHFIKTMSPFAVV